jgi:hypothetical protein
MTGARKRFGEHVPAAKDTHETIEVPLETMFSTRSVQRSYITRTPDWELKGSKQKSY